jgi:hypothetical protein
MSCKTVSRLLLTQAAALALCMPSPLAAQTWAQLSDGTGGPSAGAGRQGQTTVLDAATASMILFGGQPVSGGGLHNDVWSFNIATSKWTQVIADNNPSGPAARSGHTAVYDWAGSNMIVFGGSTNGTSGGGCLADTWVLSNANRVGGTPTWTNLTTSGGPPTARVGHSAVYDPTSNSMIIFGGQDCSSPAVDLGDVWVLSHANGQGGTPTWTQLSPTGAGPSPRFYHTAVYDPNTNTMTVFGGNSGSSGSGAVANNDVWVLSNANGQGGTPAWTQLNPQTFLGQPAARYAHTAVYDQSTGHMVIFGGEGGSGGSLFFNDVWVLYTANNSLGDPNAPQWVPLTPVPVSNGAGQLGPVPVERSFATGVYDYGTNEMILTGGVTTSAALTDVWMLQDAAVPRTTSNYVHNASSKSTFADFDGDGKSDMTTFRQASGWWFVQPSTKSLGLTNSFPVLWGEVGDIPVPVDYDGDGKTDYVVFRQSTGTWWIKLNGSSTTMAIGWGTWGDIPVAADFDGDGKVDLAVFRPSAGTWFVRSSKTPSSPIIKGGFQYGDIPLAADFDGDGTADMAVWRPSDATWRALLSTNNTMKTLAAWGISGDTPIVGEFDGDGKTDIGIFRPSTATWWVLQSSKSYSTSSPLVHPWGLPGDVPIGGDFDGDGKFDFGIWRPSNNAWYVILTHGGNLFYGFGTAGDDPAIRSTGPVN